MPEAKLRNEPKQARSRERYESILTKARALFADKGVDAVSMRDIANETDIQISAIYHFFEDRNALIWTLVVDFLTDLEDWYRNALEKAETLDEISEIAVASIDYLRKYLKREPYLPRLLQAIKANPLLAKWDAEQNERIADMFATRAVEIDPDRNFAEIRIRALLSANLATSTLILAGEHPKISDDLIKHFKALIHGAANVKLDA